jgi:hypothetical protein
MWTAAACIVAKTLVTLIRRTRSNASSETFVSAPASVNGPVPAEIPALATQPDATAQIELVRHRDDLRSGCGDSLPRVIECSRAFVDPIHECAPWMRCA